MRARVSFVKVDAVDDVPDSRITAGVRDPLIRLCEQCRRLVFSIALE